MSDYVCSRLCVFLLVSLSQTSAGIPTLSFPNLPLGPLGIMLSHFLMMFRNAICIDGLSCKTAGFKGSALSSILHTHTHCVCAYSNFLSAAVED